MHVRVLARRWHLSPRLGRDAFCFPYMTPTQERLDGVDAPKKVEKKKYRERERDARTRGDRSQLATRDEQRSDMQKVGDRSTWRRTAKTSTQ